MTADEMIDRPLAREDLQALELRGGPQESFLPATHFICMNEGCWINKESEFNLEVKCECPSGVEARFRECGDV